MQFLLYHIIAIIHFTCFYCDFMLFLRCNNSEWIELIFPQLHVLLYFFFNDVVWQLVQQWPTYINSRSSLTASRAPAQATSHSWRMAYGLWFMIVRGFLTWVPQKINKKNSISSFTNSFSQQHCQTRKKDKPTSITILWYLFFLWCWNI